MAGYSFNPFLFLCEDNINFMHFILMLEKMDLVEIELLVEEMRSSRARISFDHTNEDPHGIVLVDGEDVICTWAPAFRVDYVKECLKQGTLLDIDDFRQEATKHIASVSMDVVYFRTKQWSNAVQDTQIAWLRQNAVTKEPMLTLRNVPQSVLHKAGHFPKNDKKFKVVVDEMEDNSIENVMDFSLKNSMIEESIDDEHSVVPESTGAQNSSSDDHKLAYELSSDSEWDIEDYREEMHAALEEMWKRHEQVKKKCTLKKDRDIATSSSDKEVNADESIEQPSSYDDWFNKCETKQVHLPSTSTPKMDQDIAKSSSDEEVNVDESIEQSSSDDDWFNKWETKQVNQPSKRHRHGLYTPDEDENILKYIIQRDCYDRVKGRDLWVIMERRKICGARTWQSMKNRLIKNIVPELDKYIFLTKEQKRLLRANVE